MRVFTLAEVIKSSDNRRLGILAVKIDLASIMAILERKAADGVDEIYLTDKKGRLIVSSSSIFDNPPQSVCCQESLGHRFPSLPKRPPSMRITGISRWWVSAQ